MDIEVSILGPKNRPFKKRIIYVAQNFITIRDLLQNLDRQFNANIENEIIINGALKYGYIILINCRAIKW